MIGARLRRIRVFRDADAAGLARAAAWAGLLGISLLRARQDPAAVYPAAALIAALVLDGASRLAAGRLARGAGPDPRPSGLPSLVLVVGGTPALAVAAAGLMLVPKAAPVLAGALAGLLAIGACARLALIRIVLRLDAAGDAAAPAGRAAPNPPDPGAAPFPRDVRAGTTPPEIRPSARSVPREDP